MRTPTRMAGIAVLAIAAALSLPAAAGIPAAAAASPRNAAVTKGCREKTATTAKILFLLLFTQQKKVTMIVE